MSSGSEQEGEIITPEAHFVIASQSAKETFGTTGQDNFSLMKMVAPRFLDLIENDNQTEEAQSQGYQLSRVTYDNGILTYSLTPPLGSPLPYLEINQERGNEGFRDASIYMYKRPDFPSFREERNDRGMIDHFGQSAGANATYLESLTNAYRYLQKYGVQLENCKFPYVDESIHLIYPQIRTLKQRRQEALRIAEERRSRPAISAIADEASAEETSEKNGENTFMRRVREIVNALYPTGEIGGFGRHVLLAAEAYDLPTEVDSLARWMWRDQAEFAVEAGDLAGFMRNMLNHARKNPGILGTNERLFIVSTPPMWEPTPDNEYIALVTQLPSGAKQVGRMHIQKLNLPGGGTRAAGPGAPLYMGLLPIEQIESQLQRAIDACDFAVSSERDVAHRKITFEETGIYQASAKSVNLEIIGEPKVEIVRDFAKEAAEAEMRRQLYDEMMQLLASPEATTVEYYTEPGKPEPSYDREGAAWERFIILNSADGKYGIAVTLLQNDQDWQAKDPMRLKPRGQSNKLRLLFLERGVNIIGSVTFSPDFEALIETFPDHHAGIMVQKAGEKFATSDGGRTGAWDDGRIFMQSPKVHVGTTDYKEYTPPREMTEEELEWLLNMIKIDGENPPVFDQETMKRTNYWMMRGGHQVAEGDVDPFADFLKTAKYSLLKHNQ